MQKWRQILKYYAKWEKSTQKAVFCMIPYLTHSNKLKLIGTEVRSVDARICGWGKQIDYKQWRGSVYGGENILYVDCGCGTNLSMFVKTHCVF